STAAARSGIAARTSGSCASRLRATTTAAASSPGGGVAPSSAATATHGRPSRPAAALNAISAARARPAVSRNITVLRGCFAMPLPPASVVDSTHGRVPARAMLVSSSGERPSPDEGTGVRSFDSLTEREILALAISLEEEDARIYEDLAATLQASHPPVA